MASSVHSEKSASSKQSVTLTLAEYDELLANQNAKPAVGKAMGPTKSFKPNYTLTEIMVLVFGLIVVLAFMLPVRPLLFLPVLIFAAVGIRAFFRSNTGAPSATDSTYKAIVLFKTIAIIGISILIAYGLLIAFSLSSD